MLQASLEGLPVITLDSKLELLCFNALFGAGPWRENGAPRGAINSTQLQKCWLSCLVEPSKKPGTTVEEGLEEHGKNSERARRAFAGIRATWDVIR